MNDEDRDLAVDVVGGVLAIITIISKLPIFKNKGKKNENDKEKKENNNNFHN